MQIELHIEGNAALVDAIDKARIDLAVGIGHKDHANAQTVGQLNLVWIASSTFSLAHKRPLPLAVMGPQCIFRRRALQHLEAANIPSRIAANSPSLNGLSAALLGGDFDGMMAGYSQFFGARDQPNKPARTTVQVVLPAGARGGLVEIDLIAVRPK